MIVVPKLNLGTTIIVAHTKLLSRKDQSSRAGIFFPPFPGCRQRTATLHGLLNTMLYQLIHVVIIGQNISNLFIDYNLATNTSPSAKPITRSETLPRRIRSNPVRP